MFPYFWKHPNQAYLIFQNEAVQKADEQEVSEVIDVKKGLGAGDAQKDTIRFGDVRCWGRGLNSHGFPHISWGMGKWSSTPQLAKGGWFIYPGNIRDSPLMMVGGPSSPNIVTNGSWHILRLRTWREGRAVMFSSTPLPMCWWCLADIGFWLPKAWIL